MNMANQMNDTLPAAMAIFNSAVDDAKIRLCQVFAPMAKDAIKGVADALPSITDKVVGVVQNRFHLFKGRLCFLCEIFRRRNCFII